MENKVLWTVGAVAVGIAAIGAISVASGGVRKMIGRNYDAYVSEYGRKKRKSGRLKPFDIEKMPDKVKNSMADVVCRECGLYHK